MGETGDIATGTAAAAPLRMRLTFPLDVEVCVIGGGLAGLTVALEAARSGASVAVLEARQIGWNASGHQLGSVKPGFDIPIDELIARVGIADASALWRLSDDGAAFVRATAEAMPGIALSEGALEVSSVDVGDRLIARLQLLGEEFGTEVEGWQIERVRDALKTRRYFHGVHYPRAFQIDGDVYLQGLAALARQAGVRIFEDTPVIGLDTAGIRKRIATPLARMRAEQVVLAGSVTLGRAAPRLGATLLPVWRHAAVTAPLGERLRNIIRFQGSVADTDGIDHFRIVQGDRLMWSSPETTWDARPQRFAGSIRRRIQTIFPALGKVAIDGMFSGAVGQTVHGMPQVGRLRRGVWVASGFGRQGLNTTAMAGQLIAQGIMSGDDRWRLFAPFELVWAGGVTGRVAGQAIGAWMRGGAAAAGALARYREGARARSEAREMRLAAANRRVAHPRPQATGASQESEASRDGTV